MTPVLVLSCEHGGNRVPQRWQHLFRGAARVLASHRGFDEGALALARRLARRLGAPLFATTITRLFVDANRSESNPAVFSAFTRGLAREDRERVLARWHRPHRAAIEAAIADRIAQRRFVLHVAVHSFTPVLDGVRRNADIGLLCDPARARERTIAARWRDAIADVDSALRVRVNYPYRGTSDGLTTALRRRFGDRVYAGIELELNQACVADERRYAEVARALEATLTAIVTG